MMISASGSQGRKRCGMMMDGQRRGGEEGGVREGALGWFGNFDNDNDAVFLRVFHGMEEESSRSAVLYYPIQSICGSPAIHRDIGQTTDPEEEFHDTLRT